MPFASHLQVGSLVAQAHVLGGTGAGAPVDGSVDVALVGVPPVAQPQPAQLTWQA